MELHLIYISILQSRLSIADAQLKVAREALEKYKHVVISYGGELAAKVALSKIEELGKEI
jgi:hypothetical protein